MLNMAAGHPTDYKPEYCKEVIRLAKTNMNLYLIAEEWEVTKTTLLQWAKVHKEFSTAYARAGNILSGILQKKCDDNIENRDFNAPNARLLFAQNKMAEQRAVNIPNISKGTLNEAGQAVLNSTEEGNMTADELQKTVSALSQLAKIEEVTEQREKLALYEERESTRKNDDLMNTESISAAVDLLKESPKPMKDNS